MKIVLADTAGFCFGVNKAVETAWKTAEEKGTENLYTLGELIHNSYVVDSLKRKGVRVIDSLDDIHAGTVIIRSHGVPPEIYETIKERQLSCIDATCPYVKSIQNKVEKYQMTI